MPTYAYNYNPGYDGGPIPLSHFIKNLKGYCKLPP